MITEIPFDSLDEHTLRAVIESFINREGTDYGAQEVSLDDKVVQILKHLRNRQAFLMFDPESETVNIVTAQDAEIARGVHDERSFYREE